MKQEQELIFEDLYEAYKNLSYTIAFNILRSHELSEETVQEAFFRLSQNMDRIKIGTSLYENRTRKFIVIITRNLALNTLDYEKRHKTSSLMELSPDPFSRGSGGIAQDDFESIGVFDIIRRMNPIYGDALLMKFAYGMSYTDIGALLGISELAARKRVSRAKKILEINLKERGDYFED